jgi:hypothetical protein
MRKKHLIIPDCHDHYKFDQKRFEALGNLIEAERPNVVVCLGDFADMPSLCKQDKGQMRYEGRRYQQDIDSAISAMQKLTGSYWKKAPKQAQATKWEMCLGNHENRINREVQENSTLAGKLAISDLGYAAAGWNVHPFLVPVTIDGITYCHYYVSGVAGRAISGENIGKSLCNKNHASSVAGHSHVFDHSERAIISGIKIFGLSAGCYVHEKFVEDWNRATVAMWWRGIVILDDLDGKGYYDQIRALTQRKIMRDYL